MKNILSILIIGVEPFIMIIKEFFHFVLQGKKFDVANLPAELLARLNKEIGSVDYAIIEQKNEDEKRSDFLTFVASFKKELTPIGVTHIVFYDTLAYDNQCNFEYSKKEMAALYKLRAVLAPSTYRAGNQDDEVDETINSKAILYKLLHNFMLDIRARCNEDEDSKTIWKLTHWLHNLPLQLYNASKSDISSDYDDILQTIFDRANYDTHLKSLLLNNFETLKSCRYEIWKNETSSSLLPFDHAQKEMITENETLLATFLAINFEKAQAIFNEKMGF